MHSNQVETGAKLYFPPPRKQLPEVVEQRQRGRKCNTGGGAADGNTRLQAPQDCT